MKDLFFATKVVKTAQAIGLEARAFDSAARLSQAAREKEPALVILDCEGLEREAFQVLEAFRLDAKLSAIPRVGYLSHGAKGLKQEMRNAGCSSVYAKSEFTRELENLLMRHARGLSYRL